MPRPYLFFFILWVISGCSGLENLKEDQYLLSKQQIKGADKVSKSSLKSLYRQKPNTKILGLMPFVGIYNTGKIFFNPSKVKNKIVKAAGKYDNKIENEKNGNKLNKLKAKREKKFKNLNRKLEKGNGIMRIGEAPVIYDSSLTARTATQMNFFLVSQGFFRGSVDFKTDTSGKKISLVYEVKEGKPYFIDQIYYKIEDPVIDSLIKPDLKKSEIKRGDRFEEKKVTAERERIFKILHDHGYFGFDAGYIYFNIDTTTTADHGMIMQMVIVNPEGENHHPVYMIDSVYFTVDKNILDSVPVNAFFYKGINFSYSKDRNFSRRVLNRKIRIHPGDLYRQTAVQKTQKNISRLEMFKYVDVNFKISDSLHHKLTAHINVNTLKRNQIISEAGMNVIQGFSPGPFFNIRYRTRNVFGGFEVLDVNLRAGVAGQAGVLQSTGLLTTEEYSAFANLSFPEFFFPTKLRYKMDDYAPSTNVLTGYTFTSRPEYERSTGRLAYVYSFFISDQRQITFSPIDINIINTAKISDTFNLFLNYLQQRGNNLRYAFRSSFVSDMNVSYVFSTYDPFVNKKAFYRRYYLESGGTTNNIFKANEIFGLQTFKYFKIDSDLRNYYPAGDNTMAVRFHFGMAYPYGPGGALPYEKYFFAGGSNSIRAWRPRRLGPGSYAPLNIGGETINYQFERPGEILLETSYEYRIKLAGIFEGAVFIDAGNVWSLRKDKARPGSEFNLNSFFRQIAVGTGVGLRLNLNFLVIRFDLGIKAYDPAFQKFVLFSSGIKESVINVGIGYPF